MPSQDSLGPVTACVFDAYGTLFDVHSPTAKVASEIGADADAVSRMWRQKQLEYTWLRSLMKDHADFRVVTRDALDYALAAHGVANADLADRMMDLYMMLDAYPDARPALEALKAAGLKTAILSNGSPDMLCAAVTSAGLDGVLDMSLSVEDVGVFKPDSRVYQLAVDRLGVQQRSEICFVSTNGWDAAGAAHFGFSVVWMNRFGLEIERLPGRPKHIIEGLDALPDLVG